MERGHPWESFYPETARNFDEAAIPARLMAEVVEIGDHGPVLAEEPDGFVGRQ